MFPKHRTALEEGAILSNAVAGVLSCTDSVCSCFVLLQSRQCTRTSAVPAGVLHDLVGALFLSCLGPLQGKIGRVVGRKCECWSCAQKGIKGLSDLVFGGSEVCARGL